MKVFEFLRSRTGAVSKLGMAGMALTVGLVGMNVYNYATDTPAAQERDVRSLSSIMASGGELPSAYSSINVSAGGREFASAEERAAREAGLFDGGEAAVGALSGLNGISVRGSSLGEGEAGLGMGKNAASALGPEGKPLTGNVNADGSGVAAAAAEANQTKINKLGESKEGGLQRASMARAAGSNLGSGNSGAFGSSSGSRGAAARSEAQSRIGASSISGAMPEGTTLVASNAGLRGAASSSFVPGGREARVGHGINSKEGNSLRQIAVDSGKVAANRNRAANEGTNPFMADKKLSGGVNVVGENANTEGMSSGEDFEGEMNRRERGAAQAIDDIDTTEQERKAHRSRLVKNLFMLMLATIAAGFAINKLMKGEWWSKLIAFVLGAAMLASIGAFIADASKYVSKYGGDGWSVVSIVMGILMVGAIVVSFFNFSGAESTKLTTTAAKGTGGGTAAAAKAGSGFGKSVLQGLQMMGVEQGVQAGLESGKGAGSDGASGSKGKK